jgi:mannose-P-dolichol utilization defect protein 1
MRGHVAGENVIILIQNIVLVLLLWKYSSPTVSTATRLGLSAFLAAFLGAMSKLPREYLQFLPIASSAMGLVGRVPQVMANFKQGHTGQLSFTTQFLQFVGILARVFTTMQDTGDRYLLGGYVASVAVTGLLLAQIILFRKATKAALATNVKKTE